MGVFSYLWIVVTEIDFWTSPQGVPYLAIRKTKMNKFLLLAVVFTILVSSTVAIAQHSFPPPGDSGQPPDSRSEWVGKCLTQIETISAGSSEKDFDKLFEEAGGLSDGNTYSFRQCPYFKVSAKFKGGKVVSISRPYLDQVYYN